MQEKQWEYRGFVVHLTQKECSFYTKPYFTMTRNDWTVDEI